MHAGYFFMLLLSSADFFSKIFFFQKNSFRNNIRVSNGLDSDQDRLSFGLHQTICKGYQQMTEVTASK